MIKPYTISGKTGAKGVETRYTVRSQTSVCIGLLIKNKNNNGWYQVLDNDENVFYCNNAQLRITENVDVYAGQDFMALIVDL